MIQLTVFCILVLASTNASKFFQPDMFQQDLTKYEVPVAFDEDPYLSRFSPEDEMYKKEAAADSKLLLLRELSSLENYLQNEYRMKRKNSLSIDNPLDVLRSKLYKNAERKLKDKAITKNRDILDKVGKRSEGSAAFEYHSASNGLGESGRHSIYSNDRMEDVSYQS